MADEDKPKRKKPPFRPLDEIEDEGDRAVNQRARELFARCMKMGGRIDWAALRTGGPAVHQAFLALVSSQAAAAAAPPSPPSAASMKGASGKADPAKANTLSTRGSSKRKLPRVEKNWGHRRTSAFDFRWHAFRAGAVVTTAVCLIAFFVIRWFEL